MSFGRLPPSPVFQRRPLPANLPLVFDLDGVIVDVRKTYRLSYLQGIAWHLRHDLGVPLRSPLPASLAAVHRLKKHPGFNAPRDVVALLLRLSLRAAVAKGRKGFTDGDIGALRWIGDALVRGHLDNWQQSTLAGLTTSQIHDVLALEQPDLALARSREMYVGSTDVHAVFAQESVMQVPGLWHKDVLLLDPQRPPPRRPLGIYTGRNRREALWLCKRFRYFSELTAEPHTLGLRAHDDGAVKPDGQPLRQLLVHFQAENLLYIGDLPADRQAAMHASVALGQILPTRRSRPWPQSTVAARHIDDLLDAIDAPTP